MKNTKLILTIALIALSFSCRKESFDTNTIAKDKNPIIKSINGADRTNYFDVGGTIGCLINLTDPLSSSAGDNDAYDSCMDGMLAGTNTLGNISSSPNPPHFPAPSCLPCMVPYEVEVDLMEYFFQLLGEQVPVSTQDFTRVRDKIADYGSIILAVYTINGYLVIPEDREERRDLLLNYNGVLPAGIIAYVDFVYGKYFAIPGSWERIIYPYVLQGNTFAPPSLDINGKYSILDYGVKLKRI